MSSSKSPDWHSRPSKGRWSTGNENAAQRHEPRVIKGSCARIVHHMNDSPTDRSERVRRRAQQSGPPLVLLASICIGLLFGGLAIGVALGGVPPLPYGPVAPVLQYVRAQPLAVQLMAVAVFGSSVPLAIYAATASARLRQLGVTAPGATIAFAGGILAAGALGLTGLVGWTLSRPEISGDTALVRALYFLVFLLGGPGHIVALGLLVAGMAVPGLIHGLLPRSLARVGLATAAVSELTTLVLIWPELGPILPVARVSALVWLLVAGGWLPRRRSDIGDADGRPDRSAVSAP
jgi:hypothetical protein